MTDPVLELDMLTAAYGQREPVLVDVTLEIGTGEAVGVVGMNGAGKSTLLKCISGALRHRSGRIIFKSEDIARLGSASRARRGIVMLAEGHRVIRPLTVHENLEISVMSLSPRVIRRRFAEILPTIHELFPILADRSNQPAGLLSGGEQQMLSIARAMVQQPALLLLDEPSLGLAPLIIDRIYESFDALREQGISLMIVEQNSDRVSRACERLFVLRDGRIVDQGSGAEMSGDRIHAAYFGTST